MSQHALRTALTLYAGGTLDLRTAARQAGVDPANLEQAARRYDVSAPKTTAPVRERLYVASD